MTNSTAAGRAPRVGRRVLLAGSVAAVAAACTPRRHLPFFAPPGPPVGVQLYSVAKELETDLDGTLAALAAIGYRTVELAGYAGKTPTELRAALDRAGLRCTSAHVNGRPFWPAPRTLDDDPDLLAAEAGILGFDTVIMPLFFTPPRLPIRLERGQDLRALLNGIVAQMTEDDWRQVADYVNEKGAALKARGLRFGYHNHSIEFGRVGDRSIMELLMAHTDPALVTFQLDCGWVAAAGIDPTDFVRDHAARISAFHIKDIAATTVPNALLKMDPADVGHGIIDWPKLLGAARAAGIERFFVEQEAPYTRPVLETLRSNFDYLSALVA